MSLKHTFKESLTFSKKERVGAIFLLPVILVIAFIPFLKTGSSDTETSPSDSVWLATAGNLEEKKLNEWPGSAERERTPVADYQLDRTDGNYENATRGELFNFDPNTLDAAGFKKLGLRDKTIRTLLNYRGKGGKFRKPDDLARIYGLRPEEFERLRAYVTIAAHSSTRQYASPDEYNSQATAPKYEARPHYKPKSIEINAADLAGYESLYGIGSKLASRIINFRDKLGGFYTIEQVGETFGVPDSTFQKIKAQLQVNPALVKKININAATYDELNQHPYIGGKTAFQILKYRKEKGNFSSTESVKELVQGDDSFEKIAPYIQAQ